MSVISKDQSASRPPLDPVSPRHHKDYKEACHHTTANFSSAATLLFVETWWLFGCVGASDQWKLLIVSEAEENEVIIQMYLDLELISVECDTDMNYRLCRL